MFSYESAPPALLDTPSLTLRPVKLTTTLTPKFDLEISATDTGVFDITYHHRPVLTQEHHPAAPGPP